MLNRRRFLKTAAAVSGSVALSRFMIPGKHAAATQAQPRMIPTPLRRPDEVPPARIAFVKTQDRAAGVTRALDLLGINPVQDKRVLLKPNWNTSDPCPGSTHNDTLRALVQTLHGMGAGHITVGDRSYEGAHSVMTKFGIYDMAEELGFETISFNDLPADATNWEWVQPEDSHWQRGFLVARPVVEAESVITTCCLKTHGYGGHYTMSLKNSVGVLPKSGPCGDVVVRLMDELHGSPYQRHMIAETNLAYTPDLIVLDGVEAFTSGGPMTGTRVTSEVVLAGTDRVAIDAVGVAILRYFGTTDVVRAGRIFETEQIARAAALGIGVDRPEKIELVTDDPDSAAYADMIGDILAAG
jgi:uncharacterized protein (DUF362 family)